MAEFNKENALKELDALNKQAADANRLLTEATTKKKMHEDEIAAKEAELRSMGVDPSKIDETLTQLVAEYEAKLAEVKGMIPSDVLERAKRT